MVQHLDGGAARVLVLVLQDLHQVLHRIRVVRAHDDVDRTVRDFEIRIAQELADGADLNRAVHLRERVERGLANHLVRVAKLRFDRGGNIRPVEAREDIDDVHSRNGVLSLDAARELRDRALVRELADDAKERGLLVRFLAVGMLQQIAHREAALLRIDDLEHGGLRDVVAIEKLDQKRRAVVAARGEREADRCNRARIAVDEALHDDRERLVIRKLRQDVDVGGRFFLVGDGERIEDLRNRPRADLRKFLERLLRFWIQRVCDAADFSNQALGSQIGKETHRVVSVSIASTRSFVRRAPAAEGP